MREENDQRPVRFLGERMSRELEESRPAQKARQGVTILEGKAEKTTRGDVGRVQQPAGGVRDPIGFYPPADERGTPRQKDLRPNEAPCHLRHPAPEQHGAMLRPISLGYVASCRTAASAAS